MVSSAKKTDNFDTKRGKTMKKIIDEITGQYSQDPKTRKIERVAAYIRVSHQEQKLHGISLEAQKDKLKEYAEKHGLKIVGWYMDEGVSGRKLIRRRPELQRMIRDAEAGKFDRIIFIKLDRFFRSVAEYHECMKRIDPVLWTATEEKYDLTTANGRAFVNMKLTIAELEADQTGERIDLVNDFKVKTGQPLSGSIKFCWTIVQAGERKRIIKNPETVHIMEDLLQHIWTHQSKALTLKYINVKYGMDMSYPSLSNLLKDTMLYGEYRGNPEYLAPDDRYMTKEDFLKMQGFLQRQVKDNSTVRDYIFAGLIKCPYCGKNLKGSVYTQKKPDGSGHYYFKKYRCQKKTLRGTCDFAKTVSENVFERMMLANIEKYLEDAKIRSAEIGEAVPQIPHNKVADIKAEIDRLNYSWQKGRIKADKYDKDFDELMKKLEEAEAETEEVITVDFSRAEAALAGGWKEIYNALDDVHRRAFWRSFIQSIEIKWTTEEKIIEGINFF